MTGIPVYTQTQAPINAAKAQTATSHPQTASGLNQAPPSTTTQTPTSSYPPAQPGAAPPAPTTAAAQRYAPVQPTPTTKTDGDSPAAPRPGAVPTPLGMSSIPPPPKVGETYHRPQQTTAPTQPLAQSYYPPQMSIPPPTSAYAAQPPHASTATTTTPSGSYPASIPEAGARRSLEHPPGYQQNVYASEMNSDQRRAQEAANYSSGTQDGKESMAGIDTENVWNTAKKWLGQAGEKISEAEAEVWRKINKQ